MIPDWNELFMLEPLHNLHLSTSKMLNGNVVVYLSSGTFLTSLIHNEPANAFYTIAKVRDLWVKCLSYGT